MQIKNLYQSLLLHKSNFPIKKVYFFLTTKFCNSGYYTGKMLLAVKNVPKIIWNWFLTLFPEIFKIICNLPMWAMHRAYIHRAYIHTYTGHMCTGHTYTHRAYIQIALCRKSTNSPFLCILSKDDYKQCRLFGLHHYHSNHWHYLSYSFAFFAFFSELSMNNKLHSNTVAFFLAFLASASSCSCCSYDLSCFCLDPFSLVLSVS